ncbi:hypothetical protein KA050_00505 [Candidatus Gracilibacteria bacterium]|nr:hypothetical protein [Candidatus Gracilibacteria bacterium]
MRLCYVMAAGVALIVANTNEEERLAPASEVLMGTPGTGILGGTLQYLLDPHRQFREVQGINRDTGGN